MMDKDFIVVSPDDDLVEVSILMEKKLRFTTPVVDDKKRLIGWITSLDVTRGFREGKKKVKDVMYAKEDIVHVHDDDPARLAVLEAGEYKVFNIPVIKTKELLVDEDTCVQCQVCEENCPVDAIKIDGDRVVLDQEKCILCEVCSTKCPVGALKLEMV